MSDDKKSNLPALSKQVGELVLAGSLQHAEEALSQAADEHGDYAVAEVLSTLPPQVTALHLAGFDGAKTSVATLLVSIDYLAMIIIGGMGSILGSIFGAVFMTVLPEVLKLGATSLTGVYPQAFGLIASARDIVFGLAVIAFLMYEPQGLARIWLRLQSFWRLWPYAY